MTHIKRTKIIATLGPSITGKIFTFSDFNDPKNQEIVSNAKRTILNLIDEGVNVFRFNFSHGNHEEQSVRVQLIRDVCNENNKNVSLMLDTKGPEIRVGKIKNGEVEIKEKTKLKIYTNNPELVGDETQISVYASTGNYFMERDIKVGDTIFIDDGKLMVVVEEIDLDNHSIIGIVYNTWLLKENKRINLPSAEYSMPFMSRKDEEDIKFAIDNNFDYIALSFVNSASNVYDAKNILKKHDCDTIQLISKIETLTAIKNIDEIISVSDGIMVARGDLGLEIPYYEVPYWEKYIIKSCRFHGRPVIIATQMLDSLELKTQPTRAEVTDVFFAVERGADSTMLSGETANGKYPINSVKVMSQIDKKSEELFDYKRAREVYFRETIFYKRKFAKTLMEISKKVEPRREIDNSEFAYDAVFYFGNDIEKIRALSNIRLAASIIVVTDQKRFINYFGIYYGVIVRYVDDLLDALDKPNEIVNKIEKEFNFKRSSIVVFDEKYKK